MAKILWLSFAGLFLVSAALQFNDPDPLYWSVAYAAAALACVRFAMRSGPRTLVWVAFGIVLAGALSSAPGFYAWLGSGVSLVGGMSEPYVEQAREFIGIGIASIVVGAGLAFADRGAS